MPAPIIALAGATGDLGFRIARALVARGADTLALVRPGQAGTARERFGGLGVRLAEVDPADTVALADVLQGAQCVVSALNGLEDVIVQRQTTLLQAAVQAGVPRLIPSDYSLDYTRTAPGQNRNMDLRRQFMTVADGAPIQVTSILNGAFMDMVGAEFPLIQPKLHRIIHWGSGDQLLDFTTKNDVASFTAAAAMDADTPRFLRIAGDSKSPRELTAIASAVSGTGYKPLHVGPIGLLSGMIGLVKRFGPKDDVFPPWQGMQYMRDMMSGKGKLTPLDNGRYPEVRWTRLEEHLRTVPALRG